MNKVGIFYAYWLRDWSADCFYYLNKVAALGFDILEVASPQLVEMQPKELDELRKASVDKGIEITAVVGFPPDKDMASADNTIRKDGIEYARKTLEAVNQAGGRVFSGINYSSWPAVMNDIISDKSPWWERSVNSIKEVAKTAEDYGITYNLEVVNRFEQFLMNTVDEGIAFCRQVGSSNVKLLIDTFHMNIEEDSIKDAIIKAKDYIGHLHIGENNRKCPGNGHLPWDEIFGALKKISYQGHIVMEPFVKMGGEIGRDIRVWRSLVDDLSEESLDADVKKALEFVRYKLMSA